MLFYNKFFKNKFFPVKDDKELLSWLQQAVLPSSLLLWEQHKDDSGAVSPNSFILK